MSNPFARIWWLLALRGLAGIALAVLSIVWPMFTLEALLFAFGVYTLADGAFALGVGVLRHADGYEFWPFAVEGALSLLFGGAIIAFPDTMAFAFWFLIAGWALATGLFEFVAAIRLRRMYEGELMLAGAGLASIAFGLSMVIFPRAAMITLAWLVGLYAGVFGVLLLVLAVRLRSLSRPSATPDRSRSDISRSSSAVAHTLRSPSGSG